MSDDFFDFNTAASQDEEPRYESRGPDRIARIKEALNGNRLRVLQYLYPEGKVVGNEFVVASIHGGVGRSFSVNLHGKDEAVWSDFNGGETGKGLLDLWIIRCDCKLPEALGQIEDFFGIGNGGSFRKPSQSSGPKPGPSDGSSEEEKKEKKEELGAPTGTWYYHNADGHIIATTSRYDMPDGSKQFRPWDAAARKMTFPKPRPLYNIPGILQAQKIVLVEGEKCADSLVKLGICATTAMGGANAPPDRTDWGPLAGKDVLIWPDNDPPNEKGEIPGHVYARNCERALKTIARSVYILKIPEGKPPKWDAADAAAEGFEVQGFLEIANVQERTYKITISEWTIGKAYEGDPPDREWLVDHVFPLKAASNLAAMGGAGKGMLLLHLALQVACPYEHDFLSPYPQAFGNNVLQNGTVVIFSAEDDRDEIHRRLSSIDASGRRNRVKDKLIIVPMPNNGGHSPIVVPGRSGPETTPFFDEIREQLLSIPDLKMIAFDPLINFAAVDITKDTPGVAFVNGVMSNLATDTGAAVIVAHHLNKIGADRTTLTPHLAREKIKGVTTIIDGVRSTYCLWNMDEEKAKRVCRRLEVEYGRNKVFCGSVVKANGPQDDSVRTFVRQPNGLLMVMDEVLSRIQITREEIIEALIDDIRRAAEFGRPFTVAGRSNGLFERKEELSSEVKDIGKHALRKLAEELVAAEKIFKCRYREEKNPQWLDVKNGPFYQGEGRFEPGFVKISSG
jgi:hypothetical protein